MTATRRLGLLGGTFDPPHLGHLLLAHEAWWQLELAEVRLVPAGSPPHKPDGPRASADARARMVARAIEGHPGLTLSRAEIDRDGPSYTVDTLRAIASSEPGTAVWLVLGADQLRDLSTWRAPEEIVRLARLAVALRDGEERAALEGLAASLAPGRVDWVDMPGIAVSSRLVRARIAAGRPVRYLVPPGVEELIAGEGLYRSA